MEKNRLEAFSDAVLGGFCPVAAFAAVTLVSG